MLSTKSFVTFAEASRKLPSVASIQYNGLDTHRSLSSEYITIVRGDKRLRNPNAAMIATKRAALCLPIDSSMARSKESLEVNERLIPVSNLEKGFYPGGKFKKGQVIDTRKSDSSSQ